jgi:hypothetical protein
MGETIAARLRALEVLTVEHGETEWADTLVPDKNSVANKAADLLEEAEQVLVEVLRHWPTDEGYCAICRAKIGNALQGNDKHHKDFCTILLARALLEKLRAS